MFINKLLKKEEERIRSEEKKIEMRILNELGKKELLRHIFYTKCQPKNSIILSLIKHTFRKTLGLPSPKPFVLNLKGIDLDMLKRDLKRKEIEMKMIK